MANKKIMILGAGVYQVPLIKKAKECGYEAIVVSPQGKYPGITLADYYVDADIKDIAMVSKAVEKFSADAILTTGADVAVPTIGYVVDKYGLCGTGFEAAEKSMNKVLMKRSFVDHQISTASFEYVESLEGLREAAESIGYPVIVKAVDSSGSRGITKVCSADKLEAAFWAAKAVTSSMGILVEQYLDGREIGAQAVIVGSEVVDILLHGDIVTPPPVSVPIGHYMPLDISDIQEKKVKQLVEKAVLALGLKNTIANVDLMIVDNEPYVLEIGARMGATCLPENISLYTGVDFYKFLIDLSLDNKPELSRSYKKQANASLLLRSDCSGVVKNIVVPDEVRYSSALADLRIDVNVGDYVNAFNVGPDRIGHVIAVADTCTEANDTVVNFANSIIFEIL